MIGLAVRACTIGLTEANKLVFSPHYHAPW